MASFGDAVEKLKRGRSVRRLSWGVPGMGIALEKPTPVSKMTLPYFYMYGDGFKCPWVPATDDILADDWMTAIVGSD